MFLHVLLAGYHNLWATLLIYFTVLPITPTVSFALYWFSSTWVHPVLPRFFSPPIALKCISFRFVALLINIANWIMHASCSLLHCLHLFSVKFFTWFQINFGVWFLHQKPCSLISQGTLYGLIYFSHCTTTLSSKEGEGDITRKLFSSSTVVLALEISMQELCC